MLISHIGYVVCYNERILSHIYRSSIDYDIDNFQIIHYECITNYLYGKRLML